MAFILCVTHMKCNQKGRVFIFEVQCENGSHRMPVIRLRQINRHYTNFFRSEWKDYCRFIHIEHLYSAPSRKTTQRLAWSAKMVYCPSKAKSTNTSTHSMQTNAIV